MKLPEFNDYSLAGAVLVGAAAAILVITTITNRADLTSATLFLSGVACFMGGVFLLTLSKKEPLDTELVSLLAVPGTINLSRICADLGLAGNAFMIPPEQKDGSCWQFIPVAKELPESIPGDFSFITGDAGNGVLIRPSAIPLMDRLEKKHGLRIPSGEDELLAAIRETCVDILEIADRVDARREGDNIVVGLQGYRLLSGCMAVMNESPKCCTMNPCPVCSLIACMLATGENRPYSVENVQVDGEKQTLSVILSAAGGQ